MKLTELRCPACNGTLKIDENDPNTAVCEYCRTRYILEWENGSARINQTPQRNYRTIEPGPRRTGWEPYAWKRIILCLAAAVLVFGAAFGPKLLKNRRKAASGMALQSAYHLWSGETVQSMDEQAEEETSVPFTGILSKAAEAIFGRSAELLTAEELAAIRWLEFGYRGDLVMVGYSMEDPYKVQTAELTWLQFEREDAEINFKPLQHFTGLTKISVSYPLSAEDVKGLHLKSIGCYLSSPEQLLGIVEEPSEIKEIKFNAGLKELKGLDRFPALDTLTINGSKLTDLRDLIHAKNLKSLTLKSCDDIADFSVLSVMPWLEELSVDAENLKDISFLSSLPNLKKLALEDTSLLTLAGLERRSDTLEALTIDNCQELKDCGSISRLTGLKSLSIELPYGCPQPDLSGLGSLETLVIAGFKQVSFLRGMSSLRSLSLSSSAVNDAAVFSELAQLEELKCTAIAGNLDSLNFITRLPALKKLDLTGVGTYYDISGIFNMGTLETLILNGAECEINFDKLTDNPALISLEMDGIKLYKNVQTDGEGGFLYVDWDDVSLDEHTDFLKHYPQLKYLSLADNKLTKVDFAAELLTLEQIDISENYITDLKPLAEILPLKQVNAAGNPLSNERVLSDKVILIQ